MTTGPDGTHGDGPTPPAPGPSPQDPPPPQDAGPSQDAGRLGGARRSDPRKDASHGGRELLLWVVVAVLGCVLVLFASTRAWVSDVRAEGAPGGTGGLAAPTGGDLGAALVPVALAGPAGVVAVLAARGVARRLIGALVALCGLAAGLATWQATGGEATAAWLREHNVLHGLGELRWETVPLWPALSWVGVALMALGGLIAAARGGRWPGMSGRYERDPARRSPGTTGDRALWDALDRGDDPT